MFHLPDVLLGIAGAGDDIGEFAGFEGAGAGGHAEEFGTQGSAGLESFDVFEAGGAAGIEDFDLTDELYPLGVDHPKRAGGGEGGGEFRDSGQRSAILGGEEDQVGLDLSCGELDRA